MVRLAELSPVALRDELTGRNLRVGSWVVEILSHNGVVECVVAVVGARVHRRGSFLNIRPDKLRR